MTETMLTALNQQMALSGEVQKKMALSGEVQKHEGSLTSKVLTPRQPSGSGNIERSKMTPWTVNEVEDKYPYLYLLVAENYRISDTFCGYMDSMSVENNLKVLVELIGLSYRYGTTIYLVDRVNGTMYGRFSVGYRVINERATVEQQFGYASLE